MANEVEDYTYDDDELEEGESKKKSDLLFYLIFFVVSMGIITGAMYFYLSKKIEEQRKEHQTELDTADSLALSDTLIKIEPKVKPKTLPVVEELPVEDEIVKEEIDTLEVQRAERIKKLAKIIAAMEPERAGKLLSYLDEKDAAEILLLIQSRTSGKIMDNVDPKKASNVSKKVMKNK